MLSALFSCVELSINSGFTAQFSYLALGHYTLSTRLRDPDLATLWTVSNSTVRIADDSYEESSDGQDVPKGNPRRRRGLDLLAYLTARGIMWLPEDMFSWESLRFVDTVLLQTAFVTGHFYKQFARYTRFTLEDRFQRFVNNLIDALL